MVVTVFMLFWTVLERKSKVRLISEISEISEFSYLALGQIRKLGNLGKIFLCFRNDLNFLSMTPNLSICFHAFLQSVSWSLAEFRHNKIVQSPHENYFNVCRQHKEK